MSVEIIPSSEPLPFTSILSDEDRQTISQIIERQRATAASLLIESPQPQRPSLSSRKPFKSYISKSKKQKNPQPEKIHRSVDTSKRNGMSYDDWIREKQQDEELHNKKVSLKNESIVQQESKQRIERVYVAEKTYEEWLLRKRLEKEKQKQSESNGVNSSSLNNSSEISNDQEIRNMKFIAWCVEKDRLKKQQLRTIRADSEYKQRLFVKKQEIAEKEYKEWTLALKHREKKKCNSNGDTNEYVKNEEKISIEWVNGSDGGIFSDPIEKIPPHPLLPLSKRRNNHKAAEDRVGLSPPHLWRERALYEKEGLGFARYVR